jgi:hypothetical protein
MGDMREVFDIMKQRSKNKKLSNLESSTAMLIEKGILFESKNNGVHLIVSHNGITADFWPSTGKFSLRDGMYSRGIKNLIRLLEV